MGSEKTNPEALSVDSWFLSQAAKSSPKQQGLMKCGFTTLCSNRSVSTVIKLSMFVLCSLVAAHLHEQVAVACTDAPPTTAPAAAPSYTQGILRICRSTGFSFGPSGEQHQPVVEIGTDRLDRQAFRTHSCRCKSILDHPGVLVSSGRVAHPIPSRGAV